MDKKLITFGCSFTEFSWPTWADWMGAIYRKYINLGNGGSGHRAIFRVRQRYTQWQLLSGIHR